MKQVGILKIPGDAIIEGIDIHGTKVIIHPLFLIMPPGAKRVPKLEALFKYSRGFAQRLVYNCLRKALGNVKILARCFEDVSTFD